MTKPVSVMGGRETCRKMVRGIYGALTICSRPKGHGGKHDPIYNAEEWEEPSAVDFDAERRERRPCLCPPGEHICTEENEVGALKR